MQHDYYYGTEADQFSFYRIPKVLFTADEYKGLSTDAKTLYGILLDRMNLSAKNGWLDEKGRVYIVFTIKEIKSSLGCAEQKAVKLLNELEYDVGLITRKRLGLGKPNVIYVRNFLPVQAKSQFLSCENHNSGAVKTTNQELRESQCNNTDINNTDSSNTESIVSIRGPDVDNYMDEMRTRQAYHDYFMEQLEYEYLCKEFPYQKQMIDEIIDILVDTVCSTKDKIRISGDYKPKAGVQAQFMKLSMDHIQYVMNCLEENTTKVRNIKSYLLSSLYNAPSTISNYYSALVKNDMANGRI